jgi:hypothetical protein
MLVAGEAYEFKHGLFYMRKINSSWASVNNYI